MRISGLLVMLLIPTILAGDDLRQNPEIAAVYEIYNSVDRATQKQHYRTESQDMRAKLWVLHLQDFMANNPDLTGTQRSLVYETIGIATSHSTLFDQDLSRDAATNTMLAELQNRAALLFSGETLVAGFFQLGNSGRVGTNDEIVPRFRIETLQRKPLLPTLTADCECAVDSDYTCGSGSPTGPYGICRAARCTDTNCCCGFLWMFGCDGLCSY